MAFAHRLPHLAGALGHRLSSFMGLIAPGTMDIYRSLLTVTLASLPIVAVYAYRTRLMNILLAGLSSSFRWPSSRRPTISSNQGAQAAPAGAHPELPGHRRQTAGGSTTTSTSRKGNRHRLEAASSARVPARNADPSNFVPEKHTDFIFCCRRRGVGFLGAVAVLGVMCLLLLRLMKMGERQEEPFGRSLLLQRGGDPALRAGQQWA